LTIIENDQEAGSIDASFNNSGANDQVYAVLLQTNNNKIYLGGDFTQFSGANRIRLARLNPNGSLDNTFDAGGVLNNSVRALALQSDNKVVVGGLFTSISSTGLAYLLRFQTDGSLDTNFLGGLSGVDNAVYSIAVQQDGKLVIGGLFNNVNGAARNFIARITPRGDLDTLFSPQAATDGAVRSIAVQNDGRILIGGDFLTVNGVARSGIARLNQDGTLDTAFNPQTGVSNGAVYSIVCNRTAGFWWAAPLAFMLE